MARRPSADESRELPELLRVGLPQELEEHGLGRRHHGAGLAQVVHREPPVRLGPRRDRIGDNVHGIPFREEIERRHQHAHVRLDARHHDPPRARRLETRAKRADRAARERDLLDGFHPGPEGVRQLLQRVTETLRVLLRHEDRYAEPARRRREHLDVPHDFFPVIDVHGGEQTLLDVDEDQGRVVVREAHVMRTARLAHRDLPTVAVTSSGLSSHIPSAVQACATTGIPGAAPRASRDQTSRSRPRYWMASETCSGRMEATPARSAMVRATFRMRSWPRADNPSRVTARESRFAASGGTAHQRRAWRPLIRAFTRTSVSAKRSLCRARAAATRSRIADEDSPTFADAKWAYGTAGISRCRSMRSSSGRDSRER